jgi:hypothetical protein
MKIDKVVGAKAYSFNDKESGRLVEGINVWFTTKGDASKNEFGEIPQKLNLPITALNEVASLPFPVACEARIEQEFTSRGIKTKVVGLTAIFSEKK